MMPEAFYTTEELADYLKVSDQTIRLWIRAGRITSYKFGRAHRIPKAELDRLLAEALEQSQSEVAEHATKG